MIKKIIEKYGSKKKHHPTTDTVEQIEEILGFKLPEDYRQFAEGYTGFESAIGDEYLILWDSEELLASNFGYGITDKLKDTIGIGTNGGGEFIAMEKTKNEKFRIVLSPLIDLDKEYHIEIGESFTDFLIRLENGEKWFD